MWYCFWRDHWLLQSIEWCTLNNRNTIIYTSCNETHYLEAMGNWSSFVLWLPRLETVFANNNTVVKIIKLCITLLYCDRRRQILLTCHNLAEEHFPSPAMLLEMILSVVLTTIENISRFEEHFKAHLFRGGYNRWHKCCCFFKCIFFPEHFL